MTEMIIYKESCDIKDDKDNYYGKDDTNKGIRDAGSTADFRILFEIF